MEMADMQNKVDETTRNYARLVSQYNTSEGKLEEIIKKYNKLVDDNHL